jgi:hypothetical protein
MAKLLFMLGAFLVLGLMVLGLRHHRLELTAQTAQLHRTALELEQQLADQQVQITRTSNPVVLQQELAARGMAGGAQTQPAPMTVQMLGSEGDLVGALKRPRRR